MESYFGDNDSYFQLKPELIGHRDHRNTIPTYENILKIKERLTGIAVGNERGDQEKSPLFIRVFCSECKIINSFCNIY